MKLLSTHYVDDAEVSHENLCVSEAGNPAEIQTEYLPNTSLERYDYSNLLSALISFVSNLPLVGLIDTFGRASLNEP